MQTELFPWFNPSPKPSTQAARYDQIVNIRAAKHATMRQIASLNRQLEKLDLEENKVLGVGYLVEECSECHGHHEGTC
jgi:hypothetical protein